ncbi:MAG: hypothetical protein KGJ01_03395 [Patescibacteria group bacterium]|nr:hypothetical protein [Patescibacteria group bacterium]
MVKYIIFTIGIIILTVAGYYSYYSYSLANLKVQPFLIYYGGVDNNASASQLNPIISAFKKYPIVIFGSSIHFPSAAGKIRKALPQTILYGYANTDNVTWDHIKQRLELLSSMKFNGVLFDSVGAGWSADPNNVKTAVSYAHSLGLRVIINDWNPDTAMNVGLIPGEDGYSAENWVFSAGEWQSHPLPASSYAGLYSLEKQGIKVFMIVTMKNDNFTESQILPPVTKTIEMEKGNYISVSDQYYSAQSDAIFPAGGLRRAIYNSLKNLHY